MASALGINYEICVQNDDAARLARIKRFALQSVARELLPDARVNFCLRMVKPGSDSVEVWRSCEHEKAHYKQLVVCGSVWVCPVCSSKITERRKNELSQALESLELLPVMVTVTLQHQNTDSLTELLEALNKAWRALKAGGWWKRFAERYGVRGSVTALEVTISRAAGWHPHKHALFFCDVSAEQVSEMESELRARWSQLISKQARFAHAIHGLTARAGDKAAGEYIAKLARWSLEHEITKAPVKSARNGSFSVFQLLELFAGLDVDDASRVWARERFIEFAAAFHGKHQLQWSRGTRALLKLDEEPTEEELAEMSEDESYLFTWLTRPQWQVVLGNDARAELLEMASTATLPAFWLWLETIGVPEPTIEQLTGLKKHALQEMER